MRSLIQLEEALLSFQRRYERFAAPFEWAFTKQDLVVLMNKLKAKALAQAA
jgi:hypothetical protein